jgi:DNA-binding NarL/FixJ family response regulator
MTPIRVLIADDQALVRTGFRLILESEPDLEVVGEAPDGEHAVALARRVRPDVCLMDVRMPGMDGIAATRRLMELPAPPRVIMLTTFDLDEHVLDALRAGASGFLLKDVSAGELGAAVRVVAGGDALLAPSVTRRLLERFERLPAMAAPPPGWAELTEREREVFDLVAEGRTNAEIGAALHLSEPTVKTHVGRLLRKLDARDRVQLVVLAYRAGLAR